MNLLLIFKPMTLCLIKIERILNKLEWTVEKFLKVYILESEKEEIMEVMGLEKSVPVWRGYERSETIGYRNLYNLNQKWIRF